MGYLFTVVIILNTAALVAVGYYLRELWRELPMFVSTAVSDEVRKQDDRIEKRLAKLAEPRGNELEPTPIDTGRMRAGVPVRRSQ